MNIDYLIKLAEGFYVYASKRILAYLSEKHPQLKPELEKLNPKYLNWLDDRFGENPSKEETHPITDCLPILKQYSEKETGLSQKYRENAYFKGLVDQEFPNKRWDNPADITHLSSDDMVKIMSLARRKKTKFIVPDKKVDVSSDRVGKVGSWNLWLPSSRENSIQIAEYDVDEDGNKIPRTTWCTARVDSSNLFYNYIGGSGGKMMLFYIIKDNAQKNNDNDYLSLGFADGKPILPSSRGGVSVDRDNNGLDKDKLKSILGGDYQPIMDILTEKCNSLGGVSPAMVKLEEAAQDVNKLKNMIAGNSKEEKDTLLENIVSMPNLTLEVIEFVENNSSEHVMVLLASNPKLSLELQKKLAFDRREYIRHKIASNPSLSIEFQKILATDNSEDVRKIIADRHSLPTEVQEILVADNSEFVRCALARNSRASIEIQKILAIDSSENVRCSLARNSRASIEIQKILATDSSKFVREQLTLNINLSVDAIKVLVTDSELPEEVKEELARKLARKLSIYASSKNYLYKKANNYYMMARYK